jgi:preprotein translocase subunit YajC
VSDGAASIIPLLVLGVLAYFLFIRPARNRAKDAQKLQNSLSAGDQVMLHSGLFGTVESTENDRVQLEISPGVTVEVHRGAIGKIIRDEPVYDEPGYDAPTSELDEGPSDAAPDDNTVGDDPNNRGAN